MSFFKQEMSFSSKFGSLFTIMRDNSSVLFRWNFKCYWQKWHIKVHIFRLATARIKIYEIGHVIFETKVSFSSNFASLSNVMRDNFLLFFLGGGGGGVCLKLYMLSTKGTHHVQIFRLSTARMKINQIPCHFSSHKSVFT